MILNYLNQSYPLVENRWKIILPISVFVCLFMVVFQPFGLNDYSGPNKYFTLGGYRLVTLLVLLFDLYLIPTLLPGLLKEETWTVWKELLFLLWILFSIGLANLFYTSFFFHLRLSLTNIVIVQLFTLSIGIIPITILTIVKQNYLNRRNRISADQLSAGIGHRQHPQATGSQVLFASDNGKDEIRVAIPDLLVVDSEGNYITISYLLDGKPQSVLLRNTLSYAEKVVSSNPVVFKCHRSYLVNLDQITKVNGNSQGYRLIIPGVSIEIPVSRGNSTRLKELLSI